MHWLRSASIRASACALKALGLITQRPEELEWTVVACGGKEAIPFFQRVLNAFSIPYRVIHDFDICPGMHPDAEANHRRSNDTIEALRRGAQIFQYPVKLEDLMRIQDVLGAKKRKDDGVQEELDLKSLPLVDVDRNKIELKQDSGVRQDPYTLKLGTVPEKTPILKLPKDQKENAVKPFIQEKFDDLVGKLLDETEELHKNYQSLKLSTRCVP